MKIAKLKLLILKKNLADFKEIYRKMPKINIKCTMRKVKLFYRVSLDINCKRLCLESFKI